MAAESLEHVVIMEQREKENSFIIFDKEFNVKASTDTIPEEWLDRYRGWINNSTSLLEGRTDFVDTIAHHIAHVWSFEPLIVDGQVIGYLFIDQDTGNFEETRQNLLVITMIMGIFTLMLSGILAIFFSRKITFPLVQARNLTRTIAKGNFDVQLSSKGKDELADLMNNISSMARQLKGYRDTRQQFLSNVSHDLRTPLTYIKAYAALLKDQKVETDLVQEQSSIIYQEAIRMESLVKDLFQLMKLEEGKVSMNIQKVELVDFIKGVTKKVKLLADEKKIGLHVSSSHVDIISSIDPEQLERALLNILNNGIRHTAPGGRIELDIKKLKNKITIRIKDNGEGIPAESRPHIWDRFYRVDKSRSTKQGGSGLGLAITKQIIERHGGDIQIESTVHVGTTFIIHLYRGSE
ncbi:HAMP domain-containing histidine kinase [Alkalihalobacillus oceani]|uniref:sensor histidine kinase n=1 Tax=Halalkalibacter oceani TaxID=1653776 RepID=UPI0020403D17|nr:HAMP domain-containing sensor histidine kinase [Halalkalibacter oceani]MCM3762417.1 HAMP domain-containing histidine kinase [Halalkalibacter oceani]